jgi:probable rRNA maturation factor
MIWLDVLSGHMKIRQDMDPDVKSRHSPQRYNVEVSLVDGRWKSLFDTSVVVKAAIAAAMEYAENVPSYLFEVSIVFSNDIEVTRLNQQWRGIDRATNVLSFPAAQFPGHFEPKPLGDVIIAIETCQREANEACLSLENHVTHLLVHGFLHLLGYDHELDSDAEKMEDLEVRILASLSIENPYIEKQFGIGKI